MKEKAARTPCTEWQSLTLQPLQLLWELWRRRKEMPGKHSAESKEDRKGTMLIRSSWISLHCKHKSYFITFLISFPQNCPLISLFSSDYFFSLCKKIPVLLRLVLRCDRRSCQRLFLECTWEICGFIKPLRKKNNQVNFLSNYSSQIFKIRLSCCKRINWKVRVEKKSPLTKIYQQKGALGNQHSICSLLFFCCWKPHGTYSIFNWGVSFQIYAEESYFKHILNKEGSIKTGSPLL